jgi:hypothetical protein
MNENSFKIEKLIQESIQFILTLPSYKPLPDAKRIQEQGNKLLEMRFDLVKIEILQSSKTKIDYQCMKILFKSVLSYYNSHFVTERLKAEIKNLLQKEESYAIFYISQIYLLNEIINDKIKQLIETFNEIENKAEKNNQQVYFDENKFKSVMQRAIKANLVDDKYKPNNNTNQGQLKLLALYTSIEVGIEKPWKFFGELWEIRNLAQIKEESYSTKKLNKVKELFSKKIIQESQTYTFR